MKNLFLSLANKESFLKAINLGLLKVEDVVNSNLSASDKIEVCLESARPDVIQLSWIESISGSSCCYFLYKYSDYITGDKRDLMLNKAKQFIDDELRHNYWSYLKRDSIYEALQVPELRKYIIDRLVALSPEEFSRVDRYLFRDVLEEVKLLRKAKRKKRTRVDSSVLSEPKYKNNLHKAILTNSKIDYIKSRVDLSKLSDQDFEFLFPYWEKCSADLKIEMLQTPQFCKLPESKQVEIIISCLKENHYLVKELRNVMFPIKVLSFLSGDVLLTAAKFWLKMFVSGNLDVTAKLLKDYQDVRCKLVAESLVVPQLAFILKCYEIILNPRFKQLNEVDSKLLDILLEFSDDIYGDSLKEFINRVYEFGYEEKHLPKLRSLIHRCMFYSD